MLSPPLHRFPLLALLKRSSRVRQLSTVGGLQLRPSRLIRLCSVVLFRRLPCDCRLTCSMIIQSLFLRGGVAVKRRCTLAGEPASLRRLPIASILSNVRSPSP